MWRIAAFVQSWETRTGLEAKQINYNEKEKKNRKPPLG